MGLTINIPGKPSFVKDGIPITVTTTTTGVQAHYIILTISVNNQEYKLKHPVLNSQAKFDIAEIINQSVSEKFNLSENILSEANLYFDWNVRASEIYDYNSTEHNVSGLYVSFSYLGSANNFQIDEFMTNLRNRTIDRSDFLLLFFNLNTLPENNRNIVIEFYKQGNYVSSVNYTTNIYSKCYQVLIKPNIFPEGIDQLKIISDIKTFYINVKDFNIIDKQTFLYRNSFGVYDTISLFANKEITDNYNFETFTTAISENKFNSQYQQEVNKATYLLYNQFENEEAASTLLRELFLSEEVFIVNENYTTTPILITTSKRGVYNSMEQTFSLQITYKTKEKNA